MSSGAPTAARFVAIVLPHRPRERAFPMFGGRPNLSNRAPDFAKGQGLTSVRFSERSLCYGLRGPNRQGPQPAPTELSLVECSRQSRPGVLAPVISVGFTRAQSKPSLR